jgi:CRP/FNR family cyclic AMP-dependent transcriptional regulator
MQAFVLDQVRAAAARRHFDAGQVITFEGAPQDCLYLVLSGSVHVSRSVRGDLESSLARLGPGQCFGEIGAVDPGPASATVTADEATEVLVVSRADVVRLFADRDVAMLLLRSLAEKLRMANHRLGEATQWCIDAADVRLGT